MRNEKLSRVNFSFRLDLLLSKNLIANCSRPRDNPSTKEVRMGVTVRGDLVSAEVVVEKFREEKDGGTDRDELSGARPAWITSLANRWKKHHQNDLALRFETGAEINKRLGPTSERQPHGYEVVKTLSIDLGLDTSEISRLRRFAELAANFEEFVAQNPACKTWHKAKLLLAGHDNGDSSDEDDEQSSEVRGLIVRIRNTTIAVKKQKVVVSGMDKTELLLELQKLARALVKRAGVTLTVAELPAEVAA
jgi:translation initiation factor 1 (eIF-1/SUI1)